MLSEDYEQAQYLSSQVEQARQRAVLAASDSGAARDDARTAEQQAREHAKKAGLVVVNVDQAVKDAQDAAERAEAPTDSMVATLAGNPVSLTRAAVDQATGDMIGTEGSTTQAAGDARWVTQTGADILVAAEIERTGSETQVSGDNRWVTNEGADNTVSALLASDGSETQAAGDSRYLREQTADARYMRTIMQPTAPPVTLGAVWIDSTTGKMHYPVDYGSEPLVNLATNPSFESPTSTVVDPTPATFIAGSQNMRYSSMDTGVAGQNWADRKATLAQVIKDSGSSIVGCQENDGAGTPLSQTSQLATLMGGTWAVWEAIANNGILYKSDVFTPLTEPRSIEINRVYLQSGTQRTMTYAMFRHIASGRRVIFASVHFTVDDNPPARTESAQIVGKFLTDLKASYADSPIVVLAGDFNQYDSDPGSPYAVLAGYGLVNTRARAGTVQNATLDSYNGFDPAMTSRQNGRWIDGVLASSDVTVPTAGAYVKFAAGTTLPLATPVPSDHNLILATLSVSALPGVKMQGAGTQVTSGGGALAYQSPEWSVMGEVSACCDVSGSSSNATAIYVAGQSGATSRIGWVPGKTYTIGVTLRMTAAQTGALDASARKVIVGHQTGGTTVFIYAASEAAPNAPGVYRLSVTFTYPVGPDNVFIRLMCGGRNENVWWDGLTIVEGTVDPGPVNGDLPGWRWEGTPHASRSIYPGPSWVPVGG